MPGWLQMERTTRWLATPWANLLRSLPSRIALFVFAATLVTSLAVTGISTNSIGTFLRNEVDQKFPSILESVGATLDLWYEQRSLELAVFAGSQILRENLGRLSDAPGRRSARTRQEIEQYLSYVLDGFPQYEALFVLGPKENRPLWVGSHSELADELAAHVAKVSRVQIADIATIRERSIQFASAPVQDSSGRAAGTLHALVRLAALDELLQSSELGPEGAILLVSSDGRYLSPALVVDPSKRFARPLPDSGAPPSVDDYHDESGDRVVGSSRRLTRFDWTLVVEEPYAQVFKPVVSAIGRVLLINLAIVLLFALAAFRIARSIARPIEALSGAARRISEGERNVTIPESRASDEVQLLTRTFNQMSQRLARNADELEASRREVQDANEQLRNQNDELQRVNEVLEQLSITDGLTRLHNHRFFQDYLGKEVKRADRTGEPLALILVDVDHFKKWNDRVGHAGGDVILRTIADVMNGVIRESDLLARYGGEEFALLAPNTEIEGAVLLAEKVRVAVASTRFEIEPTPIEESVTVSIGLALYAGDRMKLFNAADRALYRAKAGGRDCVMAAEEGDEESSSLV